MTFYLDSIITFGKYSGKRISDLPQDYVTWLKENTKHKIRSCTTPPVEEPVVEKVTLDSANLENLYRVTCAKIGRQLIYENVQIPF